MNKKALVVAGGKWQIPLINFLRSRCYEVTVVDPYTTSAGALLADQQIICDVRYKEEIYNQLKDEYDIVATDQSDISVETVAYLADKLGLEGNDINVVRRYSNKYLSRIYAKSQGIPVPLFKEVDSLSAIKRFMSDVIGPYIIKPCDSQSSKGIHLIDSSFDDEQLQMCLNDALQYSYIRKSILEQFVTGFEITVEGFCCGGKHKTLAISRKQHFKTGIASRLTYPAILPQDLESRIIEANNKYVENSGLSFGPTHAEYIVNERISEFWLVEIACRGGGTLISSDIVKWVSGFDVYNAYLTCLEGNGVDMDIDLLKRSAELHFFDFGTGKIVEIEGKEMVMGIDGVLMFDFPYNVGDYITSCTDDRSRQGFVIVLAENQEQLNDRLNEVSSLFKVIVE